MLPSHAKSKTLIIFLEAGDVIYVHILGRPMVIVNSFNAAKELMDSRGANYSDRPRLVLLSEL